MVLHYTEAGLRHGSMPADRLHSSANDLLCFGRYK
ncbi:MAG: hypothetical protein RLZZ616_2238 [Pseudomonadota bacterium]